MRGIAASDPEPDALCYDGVSGHRHLCHSLVMRTLAKPPDRLLRKELSFVIGLAQLVAAHGNTS